MFLAVTILSALLNLAQFVPFGSPELRMTPCLAPRVTQQTLSVAAEAAEAAAAVAEAAAAAAEAAEAATEAQLPSLSGFVFITLSQCEIRFFLISHIIA
jgi:hypothetical protein